MQAITGSADDSGKEVAGRNRDADADLDAEDKFWQRRLRIRASLPGPGSLLYQELLDGAKGVDSSKEWPQAPLEGVPKKETLRKLANLPANGGFGSANASNVSKDPSSDRAGSRGQLPSTTGDPIFSFSRDEFDGSDPSVPKSLSAAPSKETKSNNRPTNVV